MTPIALARASGVRVEIADLGDWGKGELYAEYDPHGPVIRIDARRLRTLNGRQCRAFIVRAVAHELYHHWERLGAIPRLRSRAARERAADAFAKALARSDQA